MPAETDERVMAHATRKRVGDLLLRMLGGDMRRIGAREDQAKARAEWKQIMGDYDPFAEERKVLESHGEH